MSLPEVDRKSTRLNSSHLVISYAVFCLKKKKSLGQPGVIENRSAATGTIAGEAAAKATRAGYPLRLAAVSGIVINPHVYSFFFNDTATTEIYTLSLHDALPI